MYDSDKAYQAALTQANSDIRNRGNSETTHGGLFPGAGMAGGFYDCSIQAMSNVEVYRLSREDVVRRAHQFLQHVKNETATMRGLSTAGIIQKLHSDDSINQAIEQSIKWDIFKRQAVCNALKDKRSHFIGRQRQAENRKPSAMSHSRWIEDIGDSHNPQEVTRGLKEHLSPMRKRGPSHHNSHTNSLQMPYQNISQANPSIDSPSRDSPRASQKSNKAPPDRLTHTSTTKRMSDVGPIPLSSAMSPRTPVIQKTAEKN